MFPYGSAGMMPCLFTSFHFVIHKHLVSEHYMTQAVLEVFLKRKVIYEQAVYYRYMLKSLGLWKTTYEDPVMFKEKEQKFRLDTEGDSVGLHRVDEEDASTADAAPPTGKGLAVLKHGGSRLSYSAPGLGNSGSSSQLGRSSGLRRRSSAGTVSDQVR